jgi:hypothetical protein
MILYCRKCGNIWQYTGESEKETSCSNCKAWINIKTQRVDRPIHLTNNKTATYQAVSRQNTLLYYNQEKQHLIEYNGKPNPYTSCTITTVPKEELQDYLKNYHWTKGLKYYKYWK